MKIFLPVFLAIIAAAAVIFGFKFCSDSYSELAAGRRKNETLKEQADALKREADFYNRMREKQWQETVQRINAMPDSTPTPTPH